MTQTSSSNIAQIRILEYESRCTFDLWADDVPTCAVVGGAVHIVLDVFLATPNNLHRPIHLFRDLDGEDVAVDIKPPAETAADQMVRTLPLPDFELPELRTRHAGGSARFDGNRTRPQWAGRRSLTPEILEPRWRQLGIANCVLDIAVAEIRLLTWYRGLDWRARPLLCASGIPQWRGKLSPVACFP